MASPVFARVPSSSSRFPILITITMLAAAIITTGCGTATSSSTGTGQKLSGNTAVTVVLSGTANDQLSEFDLGFQGITLTSQSGQTTTLLPPPASGAALGAEFTHINGMIEPLVTASIPQDVYTAATVTLSEAQFVCVDLYVTGAGGQGMLDTSVFVDFGMPASAVTVNLPSPITVTGATMTLSLDLLVSQSASYSSCYTPNGISSYSITPTFSLTPLSLSSMPTNAANGKVVGLDGQITAIGTNGNSLTLSLPDAEGPRPISMTSNSSTVYQGISSASALAVGMFVDMDGAIQPDGSLLATRIAVEDPSAVEVFRGPITEVTPSVSVVLQVPRQQQGSGLDGFPVGVQYIDFSKATFQISGELTNLGTLPFVPAFTASNMVPGQDVYFTAGANTGSGSYPIVNTLTLMPQTINATVTATSKSGSFTDYTVSIASYDLFPMLAVLPDQTTVENNPGQVEVYVDSNTQLLNTQSLAPGSTLRFYGLVFNDNGTLRMDCAQVNDGVTDSSQSSSGNQLKIGQSRTTHGESAGSQQQVTTVVTP